MYYTYCPPLDITGYGKTEKEARESFHIMLTEFMDYTLKNKILLKELEKLGWSLKKNKKKPILPPNLEDLAKERPELSEILNNKNYTSVSESIDIPAYA